MQYQTHHLAIQLTIHSITLRKYKMPLLIVIMKLQVAIAQYQIQLRYVMHPPI